MRACKHRGEEIGYIGCTCQSITPVYHCLIYDKTCVPVRPEPGNLVVTLSTGQAEWFLGHNPECAACQVYEPQGNTNDDAQN